MKNIPIEQLLMMARLQQGSGWAELSNMVLMSRLDVHLSSTKLVTTRNVVNGKKALVEINTWLKNQGWITYVGNNLLDVTGLLPASGDYILGMFNIFIDEDTATIAVIGDEDMAKSLIEWFKSKYPEKGSLVTTIEDISERGTLERSSKYLTTADALKAHQSFYPWLTVSLEEYFDEFMKSNEAILVMFGEPGTGKSTLLRALIAYRNHKAWLAYNRSVVESPKLINAFFRSKANILAYEDIDVHLKNRESGNMLMSTILNASEGIMQHPGKKIVFSTNLPSIDRIDPALLRVGRCFDIMQFRPLTREEAAVARAAAGLPPEDFSGKDKWPLAEVLAIRSTAQQAINRFGKSIGFR